MTKTNNFSKELNKAKKGYGTSKEQMAFLDGVEFYCNWKIDEVGNDK